jgi:hypothetical protein
VFSVLPFNMTSGRQAGRWPMIVRWDQIVANCTAGELKQRTFAMASVVSAERINAVIRLFGKPPTIKTPGFHSEGSKSVTPPR